jgi:hypothetical protein
VIPGDGRDAKGRATHFKEAPSRMAKNEEVIHPGIKIKETNSMKCCFTRARAASLLFGAASLALSSPTLAAAGGASTFRQTGRRLR